MSEKPLFVPLKREWFEAFESGAKTTEYRRYGRGWNERTCRVGRSVTLSLGYSGRRMRATIAGIELVPARKVPRATEIYPADTQLIAIKLTDLGGWTA